MSELLATIKMGFCDDPVCRCVHVLQIIPGREGPQSLVVPDDIIDQFCADLKSVAATIRERKPAGEAGRDFDRA